jgi:hypothetical protein
MARLTGDGTLTKEEDAANRVGAIPSLIPCNYGLLFALSLLQLSSSLTTRPLQISRRVSVADACHSQTHLYASSAIASHVLRSYLIVDFVPMSIISAPAEISRGAKSGQNGKTRSKRSLIFGCMRCAFRRLV